MAVDAGNGYRPVWGQDGGDTLAVHQVRVLVERSELADKLGKLNAFRATPKWSDLSLDDQGLLVEQAEHMHSYLDVLDRRIARFAPTAEGDSIE